MSVPQKVFVVLLIVLSFSAGTAKVLQVADDVKFFQDAGISINILVLLGLFQIVGGVLLIFQKTRISGAVIVAISLFISSAVILINGKVLFGIVSLLPFILTVIVIKNEALGKNTPISKE